MNTLSTQIDCIALLFIQDEFQSSIVEDLAKIGVKPDMVTFTSDYFETIRNYAIW